MVKRFLFSSFFCFSSLCGEGRDPAGWFVTPEGKPTKDVIRLLELDGLYNPADDLQTIVDKTQKHWVQVLHGKNGREIGDLKDNLSQKETRDKVVAIAQDMGLFQERLPSEKKYRYAVCLGAFVDGVRSRLNEIIASWKSGIRFDSLVFLTGARKLRKGEGEPDSPKKLPKESLDPATAYETEYDMCKIVWELADVPEDMRKALMGNVLFVNAPAVEGRDRPGTKECYEYWVNEYAPKSGSVLAWSHPLYWIQQQLAGEAVLGSAYPLDTCGRAFTKEMQQKLQDRLVSSILDSVAKCLYEIHLRRPLPEGKGP